MAARENFRVLPIVLLVAMAGCAAEDAPTALDPDAAFDVNGAGRLSVYNGGPNRSVPATPCAGGAYDQFDFWIGEWNVTNAAGAQAGTDILERIYGGCVVHESWTSATGGRGRSINAYDRDTGHWHQTWVAASDIGHLRMAGGWNGSMMVLHGERTQPNGVQWIDDYQWTPLDADHVLQEGRLRIPVISLDLPFALTHTRTPGVVPAPEVQTTNCMSGGRSDVIRGADFWLGEWRVLRDNGLPLGTATVTSDLSGCLTVEEFATPKGYGAISFTYYDIVEERVYRTYIDSEGERLELHGGFEGGALVLEGDEPAPGGRSFRVRMTLSPLPGGEVSQRFDVSGDGGATWRSDLVLRYAQG